VITVGGTKAVSRTHVHQLLIALGGMVVALTIAIRALPADVSMIDALHVAGRLGRLNAMDFSFDIHNQYNFWSGVVGGGFLALSYFGTDQSQVQRYLTGESVAQSRLGLLFNGLVKVPMQFFILFLGAMVFAFYQFTQPPVFFNPVEVERARSGANGAQFRAIETEYGAAFAEKERAARAYVGALRMGDGAAADASAQTLKAAQEKADGVREGAVRILKEEGKAKPDDANYVFLSFVTQYMPAGVVGLVFAAIFFASMSSAASALNALASTTVIDIQRRLITRERGDRYHFISSKLATAFWGLFAIAFAQYAGRLGSLIEAVNRLGSLFYGTILGIFLLGFYFRRVRGTAAFFGAVAGEIAVFYCFYFTRIAYLWFNVVGALVVVGAALILNPLTKDRMKAEG
ncbi:MAG: solute:Na+ symporter, family, partial [Acidobacteriota bacterium]|nr:solute:Na+ symporter, family [Acidobacteriota bacterium]